MFNDAAERFYTLFEQDGVYIVSKGVLKLANKKFSRLPNEYEITLNSDADVIKVEDDSAIQSQSFSFVTIDAINNTEPNAFIDVIGVVTAVGAVGTINSQKTQRELKKRNVTLTDASLTSIELTLWNDNADRYNESELGDYPVLAVKQVKVSDFGGE
jgi:replication factor A1